MKFQRTLFRDLQILLLICLVPALMLGNEPGEVISSGIRKGFAIQQYSILKQAVFKKIEIAGQLVGLDLTLFGPEICGNGIDDDGDGLLDANDPDCGAGIMQPIPVGSFIINMGVQPQTATNALKPYGLVWYLLHEHNIPVIWSINSTKPKDGVDFNYNGVDYRGGPFIVSSEYRTPEVDSLITAWQAQGVVGITTTSEVTVPVNRILSYSMNWTLNTNNGQIAQAYLDRAGIPETAYNWTLPQNLDCCTDVFLMPHSEPVWATHNRLLSWNAGPAQGGCAGSLWAGCKAGSNVENIVNPANPAQRLNFLMLNPVAPATTPAVPDGDHDDGTLPYSYGFPTHPVMQFLGTLDGAQENGAEQIYLPTNGWRPTTFVGVWDADHPEVPSLSPGLAAKLAFGPAFGDASRGYIMYQTGHRQDKASLPENIAAQRAFFNFSFLAVGQKAIHATATIPDIMESGTDYSLTASASGGSGIYQFHWETDCGGSFSNPFSANTTYTPPNVLSPSECYIKVMVTDDCGTRVGFQNVFISMRPRPAPPVAVDDYEQTQPGSPVTVNALANDSDPNLDPLTLTSLLGPLNTGNGVFVNNGNGQVTYTPDFDFTGVDQINYRICDNTAPANGGPLCDTATIFITVDWTDEHGCLPNQYYGIAAQGNATAVLAQNSIGNPSSALGVPVLVTSNNSYYAKLDNNADYLVLDLGYDVPVGDTIWLHIGSDDGATATLQVKGALSSTNYSTGAGFFDLKTYTTNKDLNNSTPLEDVVAYVPASGAVRKLRFTRATGAGKPCVNGLRYVDMGCLSAVPVANNDAATLCEDNTVDIDVLANDSDPQDLPLEVAIVTPPLHGSAIVLPNGMVRYKPDADYSGADILTYQVCNSNELCATATVGITVYDDACPPGYYKVSVAGACSGSCILSPNNPPDAINDVATTPVNTPVTIAVQSNDIDPSGLGLTTYLGFSNPPDNGTVALDGKKIRYTPGTGFVGQDNFNYKICNAYGCDSALVTVTVLCADPADGRAIQGMVFNDANNNASFTNGELGVGNVRVRLYADLNQNGIIDVGEAKIDSALTDSQGNYVFNLGNGSVSSSSSTTYYAIAATGVVDNDFPISYATGAPNNGFVKLNSSKYVILEFANTIPFGTMVTVYLASDKDGGKATVSSSLDGATFTNPVLWTAVYSNDPGSPPPATAIQTYSYQVTAAAGAKFIKIARNGNNIYVDAASWKQTTSTGSSSTVSLSRTIGASNDDAEEEGPEGVYLGPGAMYLNSSDLEIVQDLQSPSSGNQKIGLRFNSIDIPPGAVITGATLKFKAIAADSPNTNSGATSLTIKGQAADNATTFTSATNNISSRTLTTASAAWNPASWSSGTTYNSPELKDIVQEIVNRPGWANGNSMAFVITGTGSRSASSYNGDPANAPVLDITYTTTGEITTNLPAQKDNQITGISPTTNYGASQSLDSYNGGGIVRKALFKFDLSAIPSNAVITSASMELYTYFIATANTPVKAHRLTADWTEGTANAASGVSNWTQRLASPATNWTTAGGDYDATAAASITTNGTTAGTYSFNLTNLVQSWVNGTYTNHGVILLNDPGFLGVSWRSKEWTTASQQPKLVVKYTTGSSTGYYVLQLNPATFPPNSTLTTDNIETAVVLNNGDVDCANNFGLVNHLPPIALPDTAYVDAGTSVIINNTVNDHDPEGTPLTMTILTNPPFGTAVNLGNGTLRFTPNVGFTGWQTFLYKICDQGTPTLCDTTTVSVLVSPLVNNRPSAQDDYDTTVVNIHVETDVLDNDFDQENDKLTTSLTAGIQQPTNGTVTVVNGKVVEYAPNPAFTGNDVYQYIVCDDRVPSLCDTARVFIHVKNQPPDARWDYAETQMNVAKTIPVLVNDIEPDGHSIILMSAGTNATPTNGLTVKGGTVTVSTNGTPANYADDFINYTPPTGYIGLDTFQYRVRDSGTPNMYDITYVEIRVSGLIDLELTKTVSPASTQIGQNVTFTLTLLNKGPAPATTVLTEERLTPSYQYVSDNGAGAYDPVSGVWYVPTMAVNQTRTLTITAKILNNAQLKNVTEVIAADQVDVDSRPNNDDGDQSEDDEDAATPTLVEICTNGADDDGDGLVDCADPDCSLNLLANAGPDVSICTGGSATLTASASGGVAPYTYAWSNGLGSGASKTVTPASTTTYTVTVTSANGCTATDQVVVTVVADPAISAQPAGFTECVGGSQALSVTGTGGTPSLTYQWQSSTNNSSFSNISGATAASYTPPATVAGTNYYRVVVSASGNGCGSVTSSSATVVVVADPAISAQPVGFTECVGGTQALSVTATGGSPSLTYQWQSSTDNLTFSNIGSATASSYTPPPAGAGTTYYRVVISASGNGCGSVTSSTATVTVVADPAIIGQPVGGTICNGGTFALSLVASGGTPSLTYQWQSSTDNVTFSNISGATSSSYTTAALSATKYYRVVVSAAGAGCGSVTSSVATVSVSALLANAGTDITVCSNTSVNLLASVTGGQAPFTFNWSNGLGSGASKTVTPLSNTTYTVTVTSALGCTSTDQVVVSVNTTPTSDAGSDVTICNGASTTLAASSTSPVGQISYTWSNGYAGQTQTVSPIVTTTYTVTVTHNNGCFSTDQAVVTVQNCAEVCNNGLDDDYDGLTDCADSGCGPTANAGADITICPGTPAFLSVGVTGGSAPYTYAWSNGLGAGATKTVTPVATTTYTVTVTSASGCTSIDQVKVTILACSENCTNGIDDDGDGLVDCADPDCSGVTAPVLVDDDYTTCPGMPFSQRVTYNDGNLQGPSFSIYAQPLNGSVTIDATGKFYYLPYGTDCTTDIFIYQVCNMVTGCCSQATVTLNFGDTTAPVLTNVPAGITIGCDDVVPPPGVVTAFDQCPGMYVDFNETSDQHYIGACGSYTITRTWTATDLCGNTASDAQIINVLDQTKPEIFQVYTLTNGTKIVAGVSQRVTHDWKYVKFPITFEQAPVVLTQVTTNTDVAAVSVQERNVYSQGFELRLREEEAADNKHSGELVAWLAIEPGTQTGSLNFQANTYGNVGHEVQTMNFPEAYANPPLFFSSLQTTKEKDPVSVRHSALGNTSVDFFLQEETSLDAETAHQSETLGFLAIGQGSLIVDKQGESFGETGTLSLTNAWATVSLSRKYTKPVVIVSGLTNNDGEPVNVRVRNQTSTSFQVRLQEWGYLDGNHGTENVSWIVVEGSIPGNGGYYCSGKTSNLQPGINLFAVDNCDNLVAFGFNESTEIQGNGLLTTRSWIGIDDCGNTSIITRYDTCAVAAVRVKAQLYGALIGNGNNGLMRDELRTQELVPVREPFSNLPGFPDVVDNSVNYVIICHEPGTANQQTMTIPKEALQDHLNHGDALGACLVPSTADVPPGALPATYKTIADGNWNDPAIWQGGVAPTTGPISNKSISIEHVVVFPPGDMDMNVDGKLWITNGSLTISNGNIRMQNNAKMYVANSSLVVTTGKFELWTGNDAIVDIKDSDVSVAGNFLNSTYKRKLENVCLTVGQDFLNDHTGIDTLINVTATVGGKFANRNGARMYAKDCKIRVTNGNIENEVLSSITGNNLVIWVENGNVSNLGTWLAPIAQSCISGTALNMGSIFPALENCLGISSWFGNGGCTLSATSLEPEVQDEQYISPEEIEGPGTINPVLLTTTGDDAIVDWVVVELRDPADESAVLAYATAIIKRNGSIESEDGDSTIVFRDTPEGNYFVTIRHRNHLGMMTDQPVYLSTENAPLLDFTSTSLPVRGGNIAGRLTNGKRTMWGGDFNEDGKVIYQGPYNDVFHLFSRVLADPNNTQNLANFIINGYELQDMNLDGKVIYQGPNNDRATLLYHTVLVHPSNTSLLANFIVSEKLP